MNVPCGPAKPFPTPSNEPRSAGALAVAGGDIPGSGTFAPSLRCDGTGRCGFCRCSPDLPGPHASAGSGAETSFWTDARTSGASDEAGAAATATRADPAAASTVEDSSSDTIATVRRNTGPSSQPACSLSERPSHSYVPRQASADTSADDLSPAPGSSCPA